MVQKIESRSLMYVPDGSGPHPVLCFLHGAGEAASDCDGGQPQLLSSVLSHRSPGWHAENATPFVSRFVVICPQLGRRRRWEPADTEWVDALVSHAIRDHGGDPARLVLTGFSRGGEGVFQLASASQFSWGTIWAVDPALQRMPPKPAADVRVWVHYGNDQPGAENMDAWRKELGLEPFSDDTSARRVVTALDEDHVGTCVAAYAAAHVYRWLAP
jgi:predicted esterase